MSELCHIASEVPVEHPIRGGHPVVMSEETGMDIPAWLPDGKRLLSIEWRPEASTIRQAVLVLDLQTGQETELFARAPGVKLDDAALSPDGRQLALTLIEKEARSSVLTVLPDGRERGQRTGSLGEKIADGVA